MWNDINIEWTAYELSIIIYNNWSKYVKKINNF